VRELCGYPAAAGEALRELFVTDKKLSRSDVSCEALDVEEIFIGGCEKKHGMIWLNGHGHYVPRNLSADEHVSICAVLNRGVE